MKVTQDRLEQIILEEVQAALDEKKKKKRKKRKTCKKDRKTGHCIGRTPTGAGYAAIDFTGGHVTSAITEKKKKSKKKASAKVRNRGTVVFSAKSSKVKDDKDHFPINSAAQARNALARASQYSSVPKWYKGSLKSLVGAVQRKVRGKYKSIKTTKASKKPGKG